MMFRSEGSDTSWFLSLWHHAAGSFPSSPLPVNTVNYALWLVSVQQNHWNKYTNIFLNLSLVYWYVCSEKHGPWLFYMSLLFEVSSWKKIHLSMISLILTSSYYPLETLLCLMFRLIVSVVNCAHHLITFYFSSQRSF